MFQLEPNKFCRVLKDFLRLCEILQSCTMLLKGVNYKPSVKEEIIEKVVTMEMDKSGQ